MPNLFSVSFDFSDWRVARQSGQHVSWTTRTGENIAFQLYELPPDLPVSLADLNEVRRFYRGVVAEEGGGLVSVDVLNLGELKAIKLIAKYRLDSGSRAVRNVGSLSFMFHECTYALRVEAEEKGMLGARESAAFTQLRRSLGPTVPVPQSEWARDPYDPEEQMPFPRNLSDDEEWDAQFPTHPLSRVRQLLSHVEQTLTLDPELSTLTPFLHPKG